MSAFRGRIRRMAAIPVAGIIAGLLACGDYGAAPPGPLPPSCEPSAATELNEIAGDLVNALYDVDVGLSLLMKGSTDGFRQTISGHEAFYERGEIYDASSGILRMFERAGRIRSLLAQMKTVASGDSSTIRLTPAIDAWSSSIDDQLALSDSLFVLCIERGQDLFRTIDSDLPNEKEAMGCRLRTIGPGYSSIDEFLAEGEAADWAELIPTIFGCIRPLWSNDWYPFSQRLFETFESWQRPAWGVISYNLLPEFAAAGVPGEAITKWRRHDTTHFLHPVAEADSTAGSGSASMTAAAKAKEPQSSELEGEAVAVLLPRDRSGSFFQSFFLSRGLSLSGLSPGVYDALVFASFGEPALIESITIATTPDTTLFTYKLLIDQACPAAAGRVDSWVYLPAPGPHLTNFCNCTCNTEIYEGTSYFQWPIFDPGDGEPNVHLMVAEGTFRIIVDCDSPSIRGTGSGGFRLQRRSGTGCSYETPVPASVSFAIEGTRFENSMELNLSLPDSTLFA
ncbi:MAG: hypothetical protein HKN20_11080, partial [Gemmatimonadetes bacterium]|nr:hypothetical protein [Gemmatimonadota bacterium]